MSLDEIVSSQQSSLPPLHRQKNVHDILASKQEVERRILFIFQFLVINKVIVVTHSCVVEQETGKWPSFAILL